MASLEPANDCILKTVLSIRDPADLMSQLCRVWAEGQSPASLEPSCARIIQTHYKPFERARLVIELDVEDDDRKGNLPPYQFLQVYPTRAAALRRLQSAREKRQFECCGPAVFFVERWNAVGWTLPNGPRLRRLETFFKPELFQRFVSQHDLQDAHSGPVHETFQLIRYVPRRRALFRFQDAREGLATRSLYIKQYYKKAHETAAGNLQFLTAARDHGELGFSTPQLLAHDRSLCALVMDEVPGSQFTQLMVAGDADGFARVGRALAELHASHILAQASWSPEQELIALTEAMHDVQLILPALEPSIEALVTDLRSCARKLAFDQIAPIHANLFGDQILLDGPNVGIVDWDDLRMGDPLYDVGRLLAHFRYVVLLENLQPTTVTRCIQTLLAAYEERSGGAVNSLRLAWHVAVALLLRAKISSLRPLPTDWVQQIAASVAEARCVLDAGTLGY